MIRTTLCLAAYLGMAATHLFAQTAPSKVGLIDIQQAVLATRDGQKAAKELEAKFLPKRQEIEKKQNEIQALQQQLRASANTASEEIKGKLARDIEAKQKSLQRDGEDAQAEFDQERQALFADLGSKVMAVVDKFGADNGFAVIMDISAQQSPVLFASSQVNVTKQIIDLFDKSAPAAAPPAAAPAPTPVKPKPAGAK